MCVYIHEQLVAGLLGVESGQDAVLRELLYERKEQLVPPYGVAVEEFTNRISILRSKLGNRGLKDEGIVVPTGLGAEGRVRGNILAGDVNSLAYSRTPEERLSYVTTFSFRIEATTNMFITTSIYYPQYFFWSP